MIADCEKFDVFENKWVNMPKLNHPRGNPGTLISKDRRYLYAFQGFLHKQKNSTLMNTSHEEVVNSIERIDL
jgi:hypothetical protein